MGRQIGLPAVGDLGMRCAGGFSVLEPLVDSGYRIRKETE